MSNICCIFAVKINNSNKTNSCMPEIFRFFGFSFFFFSNEHEPIHIHVKKGKSEAKFVFVAEKDAFVLESVRGIKSNELSHIQSIIDENKQVICTTWKQFFYGQD